MAIITKLGTQLETQLKTAKSAYIASALCSDFALKLLSHAPKKCAVKIVTGVNLPTPATVLHELRTLYHDNARIFKQTFYHPKVYIFQKRDDSYIAYISSGNFTQGGLYDNIELTYEVTDPKECKTLLDWFTDDIFKNSSVITDAFLEDYKAFQKKWNTPHHTVLQELQGLLISSDSQALKLALLNIKNNKSQYQEIIRNRKNTIKNLKETIDYANDFKHIHVDDFLGIHTLGHIIPIYKKHIKQAAKNGRLQRLFNMLTNQSLSISERYRLATKDKEYKVYGCGKNIITKIMCIDNPQKCIVYNNEIAPLLDLFDFKFVPKTSEAKKYAKLCEFFQSICSELDIKDFTILDAMLWKIKHASDK